MNIKDFIKKAAAQLLPSLRPLLYPALAVLLAVLLLSLSLCHRPAPAQPTEEGPTPLATAPYGPEDFYLQDGFMRSDTVKTTTGVDVSEFQVEIDWPVVKEAGIEFAIVRAGYRGTTEGRLNPDVSFLRHLHGARMAGLEVGVYFFSQAITPEEAVEEAKFVLNQLGDTKLDLPVVFDWEYVGPDSRTAFIDSRTLTDCTIAFCETIRDGGYEPMVYFNLDLSSRLFLLEELQDYGFWLAMYEPPMDFPWRIDLWQYTESGTVPGIDSPVDLNLRFS